MCAQGGPAEVVVSLADVVSYNSTDPTMGQDLVFLTKVRAHTLVMPAHACLCCTQS